MVQPPLASEQQDDDRDPEPCPPEDDECFDAPDAESMEEAINKFVVGLESPVDLMAFTDSSNTCLCL